MHHENRNRPKICFISKLYHFNNIRFKRLIHIHTDITEVVLVINGKGEYVVNGRSYAVTAGDLIFCQSGLSHYEVTDKNQNMDYYCLGIANFNQLDFSHDYHPVHATESKFEIIKSLFESVYQMLATDLDEHAKSLERLLDCILDATHLVQERSDMKNRIPTDRSGGSLSHDIYKYLSENYDDEIYLKQLSDTFHASESLISHYFSAMYHISPMKFLQSCRIGATQSNLIITDRHITDICLDVGYNSLSNYNATFQNRIGMSPRQYRRYYRSLDYIQLLNL